MIDIAYAITTATADILKYLARYCMKCFMPLHCTRLSEDFHQIMITIESGSAIGGAGHGVMGQGIINVGEFKRD